MNFPIEILIQIATELNATDISSFRLTNRLFASAGAIVLPKNGLSVINSGEDIVDVQLLLEDTSIAKNVKSLRLFHIEWPLGLTKKWETHAVWFRRHPIVQFTPTHSSELTLYEEFTKDQRSRRYFDEVERLSTLLEKLPTLNTIIVSCLHDCFWSTNSSRYQRLHQSMWESPYPSTEVSGTLEQLFLSSFTPKISTLKIFGYLDPTMLHLDMSLIKLRTIRHLTVQGFTITNNDKSIEKFLRHFPGLEELCISFHGWGPVTILGSLEWRNMKEISLHGVWTAEEEFYSLFQNHSSTLRRFDINNSSLTLGSWESLFTKMRELGSPSAVSASGELYGRTKKESLNMDCLEALSLERFMMDMKLEWPFPQT